MYAYSTEEYADIVFVYGFCNGNSRQSVREYQERFPHRHLPHHSVYPESFRRLRETGNPAPAKAIRPHEVNVEHEEAVVNAVIDNPSISTRRIAHNLHVSQNFVWRVLNREVLHPYHLQNVQALQPGDAQQRLAFCHWLLQQHAQNNDFISHVVWSDESCFTRDGINNCHNEHVWALQNPHAIRARRFQQRFSINVWGGIFNNNLLGLHVLNERLNADYYRRFLDNTLFDLLEDVPLNVIQNMWYQHDGAPPHRGRVVVGWLNEHFGNRWIGNAGPIAWPPRSPDLNPLDFYLWGHMKQIVYHEQINTQQQLLERIQMAANEIRNRPDIFIQVKNSLVRRCEACILAEGGHFEQLL